MNEQGYYDLAEAIIMMAVFDYRKALSQLNNKVIKECEEFFKSEWGDTISPIDLTKVIER